MSSAWIAGFSFPKIAAIGLPILVDAAIKGVLVLGLAWAATCLMRRSAAAARHLVWLLAVASLGALPVLSAVLPGWNVLPDWMILPREAAEPVAPAPDVWADAPGEPAFPADEPALSPVLVDVPQHAAVPTSPVQPAGDANVAPAAPPPPPAPEPSIEPADLSRVGRWQAYGLSAWLAGTLLALVPLGLGMLSLRRLGRKAERISDGPWASLLGELAAEMGVKHRVDLLLSGRRSMPMHWGILRPRLLLPALAARWPADRVRLVLLHELGHVRRRDCLAQLAVQIVCALYWFNPLVWVASRRMQLESEAACDDLTLRAGYKPSDYAQHLLEIASGLEAHAFAAYAAIAMARRSRLEGRLLAILDPGRNRRRLTRLVVAAAVVALASVVIPLAMLQAGSEREGGESQPTTHASSRQASGSSSAEAPGPDDVSVRYAKAAAEVGAAELRQAQEASRRVPGTVPPSELRRLALAYRQAQLDVERAEVELHGDENALKEIDVRRAKVKVEVAEAELRQAQEASRRVPGTVPASELRRLALAYRQAQLDVERAEVELRGDENALKEIDVRLAKVTVEVAEADLQQAQETNDAVPGTVSFSDLQRLVLAVRQAQLEVARAERVAGGDEERSEDGDEEGSEATEDDPPGKVAEVAEADQAFVEFSGRVVDDETGVPIEQFTLQWGWPKPDSSEIGWGGMTQRSSRRRDGRFQTTTGWQRGRKIGLRVLADGYLPEPVTPQLVASPHSAVDLVVRLKRGPEVRGRVLDPTQTPVAGAKVYLGGNEVLRLEDGTAESFSGSTATTDAEGRFVLRGAAEGENCLVVSAPSVHVWKAPLPEAGQEATIQLPEPATLKIRYHVQDGDPEATFRLELKTWEMEDWKGRVESVRKPSVFNRGETVLADVTPGTYDLARTKPLRVGDMGKGVLCDRRDVSLQSGQSVEAEFVRTSGRPIAGQVVGLKEKGLPGAFLYVKPAEATGDTHARDEWKLAMFDARTCGVDGAFQTEIIPPGRYTVIAEAYLPETPGQGFSTGWRLPDFMATAKVTISEDGPAPTVQLELKPLAEWRAGLPEKAAASEGEDEKAAASEEGEEEKAAAAAEEGEEATAAEATLPAAEPKLAAGAGFESVSMSVKSAWGAPPEQVEIKADGSCLYAIEERPARGDEEPWPPARLVFRIDVPKLRQLEELLEKTDWMTAPGGEGPALHTDADQYTITLVRGGKTRTITCHGRRPEPYRSLIWFFRGIAHQENLLYTLTRLPRRERSRAWSEIRAYAEALEGKSGRGYPIFDIDYTRYLPTFTQVVRNPSGRNAEEVIAAIRLVTFLRAESEFEPIATLAHDRDMSVRQAVAEALADFGGQRAVPVLAEMARSTREAIWGLIRLGDVAVPSIVQMIQKTGSSGDWLVGEHIVRGYMEHWNELPAPVDERVVAAVRKALAAPPTDSTRTEYHEGFLELVESRPVPARDLSCRIDYQTVSCPEPMRFIHGWYTVADGKIVEHGAAFSPEPGTKVFRLRFEVAVDGSRPTIRTGWEPVRGPPGERSQPVMAEWLIDVPEFVQLEVVYRYYQDKPKLASAVHPVRVTSQYRTLWEGRLLREGRTLKRIVYVARVASLDEPVQQFVPPGEPAATKAEPPEPVRQVTFRGMELTHAPKVSDPAVLHDLQIAWRNDAIRAGGGTPRDPSQTTAIYTSKRDEATGQQFTVFLDSEQEVFYICGAFREPGKRTQVEWYGPFKDDPHAKLDLPR